MFLWGCLFGVVFWVVLLFGGFFWVFLVLFCYCLATVLLEGLVWVVSVCFSGSFQDLAVFSCRDSMTPLSPRARANKCLVGFEKRVRASLNGVVRYLVRSANRVGCCLWDAERSH